MKDLLNKTNQEKYQFKSYYCGGCKQRKPCQLLTSWDDERKSYCCECYYQSEQEKAKEYSNYQQVYQRNLRERQETIKQYQLLRNYQGCPKCGRKEVDAYSLYENSQLICQPCLAKKAGGSSSPISFMEQRKWYKKWWKIELEEWLEKYGCLPVNKNCAERWLKDKGHLRSCDCLEQEAEKLYLLFSNSLKEKREKLKGCQCEESEKVRVSSDDYTWCEICEGTIKVASKKRVIKNRNDPRFWGLSIKEKVLCGGCLGNLVERMPVSKKYTFRKYEKRGYWKQSNQYNIEAR